MTSSALTSGAKRNDISLHAWMVPVPRSSTSLSFHILLTQHSRKPSIRACWCVQFYLCGSTLNTPRLPPYM